MLCQIGRCYDYAVKFDRILIIDSLNTKTFREPLDQYMQISNCDCYFVDGDIANFLSKKGLSSIPPDDVFPNVGLGYPPQMAAYCMDRGFFHWNGIPLTFDFGKDYKEKFLIHHQCGGGMPSALFLSNMRFTPEITSSFFERLSRLPTRFSAYHCRNTDVQANLNEALIEMRKLPSQIYVATDSFEALSFFRSMLPERIINFSDIPNLEGKNIHDHFCDVNTKRVRNTDAFLDLLTLGMATWYGYSKNLQGCKSVSGFSLLAGHIHSMQFTFFSRALDLPAGKKIPILARLLANSILRI